MADEDHDTTVVVEDGFVMGSVEILVGFANIGFPSDSEGCAFVSGVLTGDLWLLIEGENAIENLMFQRKFNQVFLGENLFQFGGNVFEHAIAPEVIHHEKAA